jgi:hypothetical protein
MQYRYSRSMECAVRTAWSGQAAHPDYVEGSKNMRARTLATVLLAAWSGLLVSGAAHAADWRSLSADTTTQVFVDRSSVTTEGAVSEAVVLVNYSAARTLGDDWFPHRSQVVRYKFACDTGEAALKSWAFKTGELGGGTTVWKSAQENPQLVRPAADTVESLLVAKLCTGPVSLR